MLAPNDYLYIDHPDHVSRAAQVLASGLVLGHAFGNFYVITTRPDADIVRRVNLLKGRPPDQVGSVLTTKSHMRDLFEWSQLPDSLDANKICDLMDDCFSRGPIGFRGPAATHMPPHLTFPDAGITTTQLIAPGYRCACNFMLDEAMAQMAVPYFYVTSANRSRHQTGADDEPAHYAGNGLQEEFGHETDFHLIRHRDEAAARASYPAYAPMSTTILAFHKLAVDTDNGRPMLVVERHGSLPIDDLRAIVSDYGFGLVQGPKAVQRLAQRDYGPSMS